jgi:plasmid stabilization system protein ParE
MKLRWSERACRDLKGIHTFIGRDSSKAALRWVDQVRSKARGVLSNPRMGRVVPEFARDDIREVFLKSYRIVYRIRSDSVEILTVFEGHRLLGPDDQP